MHRRRAPLYCTLHSSPRGEGMGGVLIVDGKAGAAMLTSAQDPAPQSGAAASVATLPGILALAGILLVVVAGWVVLGARASQRS